MKTQILLLIPFLLAGTARAEMGLPADIPEDGRIRIDGRLEDWKNAEWTPLTQSLDGNPVNISNAQWSIQWNDDPALFIAIRYDDAGLVLQDRYVNSNAQDCVEIFVRGDTGSNPADYSENQSSAQHYIFGLAKNKTATWKKMAGTDPFPAHNPATAAIRLEGNTFACEINVPLYDKFDAASRLRTSETEVCLDLEIGVDIAIVDAGVTGYAGRKTENTMPDKSSNADHIAIHRLGE
jgi:hypothetical protein